MSAIEAKLAELEARVAKLESGTHKASSGGGGDTLPASKLQADWADKSVRKVPSNWKHRDITGMKYSELSAEEANDLAGFFDWKSRKGAAEVPVRLNNAGKPWHENDAFEAKLLRTWGASKSAVNPDAARYGTSGHGASAKHAVTPEPDADLGAQDDFPF